MRAINKGSAPDIYKDYKAAWNDLATRIGWFCSYCEMPVNNMIEVEHVVPVANGGGKLDWNNFLLACRYCNGVKSNRNLSRNGYLWPDVDHTDLAFAYSEAKIIEPAPGLPTDVDEMALNTIQLMGLDRTPHAHNEPTDRDSRWIKRGEAIGIIEESYSDWLASDKSEEFARQIARTALGHGFYSFWCLRFVNETLVLEAIREMFPGTYTARFKGNKLVPRSGGRF